MADYNRVKIGAIYLTDDGLGTGVPCRVEVAGLSRLKLSKTGVVRTAADGTPYPYTLDNAGQGAPIQIRSLVTMKNVFDDVVAEIEAAAGAPLNITVDGDTGSFDLDCYPAHPNAIEFPGGFSEGRIEGVTFNFVVKEINSVTP
jgi:hypothetical protein